MLISRRQQQHSQHLRCKAAALQFIRGVDEPSVPDVKLTRSKDGSSGTATFVFDTPSVFESSEELGDITGLFMTDDEGDFSTVDVQAKFVNGKPDRIEARYVMRSAFEWDRFMRFMERYAEKQGLGFQKVQHLSSLQMTHLLVALSWSQKLHSLHHLISMVDRHSMHSGCYCVSS